MLVEYCVHFIRLNIGTIQQTQTQWKLDIFHMNLLVTWSNGLSQYRFEYCVHFVRWKLAQYSKPNGNLIFFIWISKQQQPPKPTRKKKRKKNTWQKDNYYFWGKNKIKGLAGRRMILNSCSSPPLRTLITAVSLGFFIETKWSNVIRSLFRKQTVL